MTPLELDNNTKGSDIYAALVFVFREYRGLQRCSWIVIDAAKAMRGKKMGLVTLLSFKEKALFTRKNYVKNYVGRF